MWVAMGKQWRLYVGCNKRVRRKCSRIGIMYCRNNFFINPLILKRRDFRSNTHNFQDSSWPVEYFSVHKANMRYQVGIDSALRGSVGRRSVGRGAYKYAETRTFQSLDHFCIWFLDRSRIGRQAGSRPPWSLIIGPRSVLSLAYCAFEW
jgi:hypothetical protein